MENEIAIAETKSAMVTTSPDVGMYELIEKIALGGGDIAALEKVIELHNSQQDREAHREFESAFVVMQGDLPKVAATRHNNQTNSDFAKLEDIDKVVKPILKEHGFATRYQTHQNDEKGLVTATCILSYKNGHSERNSVSMPVDDKGIKGTVNKTQTHGTASALSYAKRYAKCGVLDIAIGDDDGNAAGGEPRITSEQQSILLTLLQGVPESVSIEFYKSYPEVKAVPLSSFASFVTRLKEAANA